MAVFSLFIELAIIDEDTQETWNEAIEIELQPYTTVSKLPGIIRQAAREQLEPNQHIMSAIEAEDFVLDVNKYPGASTELQ